MIVHRRVTQSIQFTGTDLYTWVKRGAVRVKCLAQDEGGSVAEWFRALDLRSLVQILHPTPTVSGFVLSSPEFNYSTALCK